MTTTKLVGLVFAAVVLAGCTTPAPLPAPPPPPPTHSVGVCSLVPTKADCPGTSTKVPLIPCKGASCDTDVNVVWAGNACQVMVAAQIIKMDKGNGVALMRWFLPPGSKWEFREEATPFALPIHFIDQNAPGLQVQFSDRKVIAEGRGVHIKNMNKKIDNNNNYIYDYKLRVFKKGGGPTDCIDSTDPAIQNDP